MKLLQSILGHERSLWNIWNVSYTAAISINWMSVKLHSEHSAYIKLYFIILYKSIYKNGFYPIFAKKINYFLLKLLNLFKRWNSVLGVLHRSIITNQFNIKYLQCLFAITYTQKSISYFIKSIGSIYNKSNVSYLRSLTHFLHLHVLITSQLNNSLLKQVLF